jgi:hypothetical protein
VVGALLLGTHITWSQNDLEGRADMVKHGTAHLAYPDVGDAGSEIDRRLHRPISLCFSAENPPLPGNQISLADGSHRRLVADCAQVLTLPEPLIMPKEGAELNYSHTGFLSDRRDGDVLGPAGGGDGTSHVAYGPRAGVTPLAQVWDGSAVPSATPVATTKGVQGSLIWSSCC